MGSCSSKAIKPILLQNAPKSKWADGRGCTGIAKAIRAPQGAETNGENAAHNDREQAIKGNVSVSPHRPNSIKQDVENRPFSPELFFCLKSPPLRRYRVLHGLFCKKALYPNSRHLCSREILDGLERYAWPDNSRELQNSLARVYLRPEMALSAESLRVAFAAGIERPVGRWPQRGGSEAGGDPHGADGQRRRCGRGGQKIEDKPRDPVPVLEKTQYFPQDRVI